MSITKTTRTYITVECDKCQLEAPSGYTNREAIEVALDNGFVRARTKNLPISVYFFCSQCVDVALEELGETVITEGLAQ